MLSFDSVERTIDISGRDEDYPSIRLLGVRIDDLPSGAVVDLLVQQAIRRERTIAVYINIHTLNLAHEQRWFKKWLNDSNLAFCD